MWDAGLKYPEVKCNYSDLKSEIVKLLPFRRAKVVAPGALTGMLSGSLTALFALVSVKDELFFERHEIQQRPLLLTTATRRGGKNVLQLVNHTALSRLVNYPL